MIALENHLVTIVCNEDGSSLAIIDKHRWTRWALDYQTLVFGRDCAGEFTRYRFGADQRLVPQKAEVINDALQLTFQAGTSSLVMRYHLDDQGIEVRLPLPVPEGVGYVSLPGSFVAQGEKNQLLIPIMQGMLWDGKGPEINALRGEAHHMGFSMPILGYLAEHSGLLAVAATRDDLQWWFGKDVSGRFWATNIQIDSLGSMTYERRVRLYPTEPTITAIAKRYRKVVIDEGRFKNWEQKIAERPAVERIFGALMTFIGYCRDDEVDYVESCRKLKAYGFERALIYPARFNIYYKDIRMGGVPAIDLSREVVAGIRELGYDVAPWSWLNEALDDGTEYIHSIYRRNPQGNTIKHWRIDDQQWYLVCYSAMEEYQKNALADPYSDMTWDHFDVLSCVAGLECYALDHPNHLGRPLSRAENREWVRRTFRADTDRGLLVSSENFNDAFAADYDFGSVKAWPQYGYWPFWPVPLTMLVYHDSVVHSWWEVHSYNNHWRGRTKGGQQFEYSGGRPRLMAALDALMGCPPDVLPFGSQYGYTGRGTETFLYKYRFEDPEVQIALQQALPVSRLHKRIGRQEMVDFQILSPDGYIQQSTFADGTRVIANFSRDFYGGKAGIDHVVLEGIDAIAPESWQVLD